MSDVDVHFLCDAFPSVDPLDIRALLEELRDSEAVSNYLADHPDFGHKKGKSSQNDKQQNKQNSAHESDKNRKPRQPKNKDSSKQPPKQKEPEHQPSVIHKKPKPTSFAQVQSTTWGGLQTTNDGMILSPEEIQKQKEQEEKAKREKEQAELEAKQKQLEEERIRQEQQKQTKQPKNETQNIPKEEAHPIHEGRTTLFVLPEIANIRYDLSKFGSFQRQN